MATAFLRRFAVIALLLAACRRHEAPPQASVPDRPRGRAAETRVDPEVRIRGVDFLVDPGIRLEVRELTGRLQPTASGELAFFDDPSSFRFAAERGEVAISTASMAALLNHYTFGYPGAPLSDLELEIHEGKLRQKGTLHKGGLSVPIEMDGELSLRPDGKLQLHPTSIKAGGVGVTHLLDALDVQLVELIKVRADRGVALDGDDLLLAPRGLLPPPGVVGELSGVRLEGGHIVLEFGGGPARGEEPRSAGRGENFMAFRGGGLRFGKLTMRRTDLRIVDADARDPFLFDFAHYRRQLVAGYSITTADLGLVAVMPDADEADKPLEPRAPGGGRPG
jgi:hypothetical protein